jgi:hypothetical protein
MAERDLQRKGYSERLYLCLLLLNTVHFQTLENSVGITRRILCVILNRISIKLWHT